MFLLSFRIEVIHILRLLVLISSIKFSIGALFHGVILENLNPQDNMQVCLTLDFNLSNVEYVSYLKLMSLTKNEDIYIYERESIHHQGNVKYRNIHVRSNNKQDINKVCFNRVEDDLAWQVQIQNLKTSDYTYQKKFEFNIESEQNIANCYVQTGSQSRIIFVSSDNAIRLVFKISPKIVGNTIIMGHHNGCDTATQIVKIVWQNKTVSKTIIFLQDMIKAIDVFNEQIYVTLSSSGIKKYKRYLARHDIDHDEVFLAFINKSQPDIYISGKAWILEGSNLNYICTYHKINQQHRWYFNNEILPKEINSVLSYKSVNIGIMGIYKCEVVNGNEIYTSLEVSLKIYAKPKVYLESETTAIEGTNLHMVCNVNFSDYSVINMTWRRDMVTHKFHKNDENSSHQSTIYLDKIHRSRKGIYQCIVTVNNDLDIYASNSINLTVYYPPSCNSETEYRLIYNKSTILKCSGEAQPEVEIFKWYKDKVNDSNIILEENQNELFFQGSEKENELYICHPYNSVFNNTFCKFKLHIINKEIIQIMEHKGYLLIIVILIVILVFVLILFGYKRWKKTSELTLDQINHIQGIVSFKSDVNSSHRISIIDPTRMYQQINITCVPFIPVKCFKLLGNGCYGEVYQGKLLRVLTEKNATVEDKYVAVKVIKDTTYENKFEEELRLHFDLPAHAHVIQCLGKTKIKGKLGMILEFLPNGTLKSSLHTTFLEELPKMFGKNTEFFDKLNIRCFKYAREIALGMEHIVKYKLVHRDLATRNILLDTKNSCKIGDFGLSRDISENNEYLMQSNDPIPVRWLAPEALSDRIFTEKSDVWAYGVVLWEIIALGGTPYTDFKSGLSVKKAVIEGYRMPPLKHSSEEIYAIMKLCWDTDPDKRPTFSKLMEMVDHILEQSRGYINFDKYETSLYEEIDPNIYKEEVIED